MGKILLNRSISGAVLTPFTNPSKREFAMAREYVQNLPLSLGQIVDYSMWRDIATGQEANAEHIRLLHKFRFGVARADAQIYDHLRTPPPFLDQA